MLDVRVGSGALAPLVWPPSVLCRSGRQCGEGSEEELATWTEYRHLGRFALTGESVVLLPSSCS